MVGAHLRHFWRRVRYPVGLFFASRAAILFVTHVSIRLDPRFHRSHTPMSVPSVEGLCWWDCGWFSGIAQRGYVEGHWTNFFPLVPILGRGLHLLTGVSYEIAMVLVSNAFALGSYMVLYALFKELSGEREARWGLLLFIAWPLAFFHAAGYSESAMIFFTALSALLARRGHHLWAGVAVGFGALSRHLSFLAGILLFTEQVRERGLRPRALLLNWRFLGLALPFIVSAPWFIYQWHRFGDPFLAFHARSKWGAAVWYGLRDLLFTSTSFELHYWTFFWLSLFIGACSFALLLERRWWTLASYGVPLICVYWAIGVMGLGRYTASCWPAFLPLGVFVARREWAQPLVLVFALAQGMYLYLFSHSFTIN